MPRPDWIVNATADRTDWTLDELYELVRSTPSDIYLHVPVLREYASQCGTVTEMGMRHGVSTIALLHGCVNVTSYDLVPSPMASILLRLCPGFSFIEGDSCSVSIRETDLLFIDTLHTYGQLRAELIRHASKARRWIVLHDTETFGVELAPAIRELLAGGQWTVKERRTANHGLTVLERCRAAACRDAQERPGG